VAEISKEDDIWEVIQLLNGETYIYHKGFKEEALMGDVFKYNFETCQFSRFDAGSIPPVKNGKFRLNRAAIALAWYIDPNSVIVHEIKKIMAEQKG
jgi:hypothetical protein